MYYQGFRIYKKGIPHLEGQMWSKSLVLYSEKWIMPLAEINTFSSKWKVIQSFWKFSEADMIQYKLLRRKNSASACIYIVRYLEKNLPYKITYYGLLQLTLFTCPGELIQWVHYLHWRVQWTSMDGKLPVGPSSRSFPEPSVLGQWC